MRIDKNNFSTRLFPLLRRHLLLFALAALELVVLLFLVVRLFYPVQKVSLSAEQFHNIQQGILTETTDSVGYRTLKSGQTSAFRSLESDGLVPWLQSETLHLPAGQYRMTVCFISNNKAAPDSAGQVSMLTSATVTSPSVPLGGTAGEATGNVWLEGDASDVLLTVYSGDETLAIQSVQLQEQWNWRVLRLVLMLVLFAVLDVVLLAFLPDGPFGIDRNGRLCLLALVGAAVLVSLPALSGFISYGFDLQFHLSRISGIAEGLRAGEFPVRIYPDSLYGYGYASPVFYGDLFLYFPAVLYLAGLPLFDAYNIYVVALNVLTLCITFFCVQRIFHNRLLSVAGTILYISASYRVFNLYYRPALGEASAQTFLPLLVYGFWALLADEAGETEHRRAWIPLMLGFSGIIESHVISTEIAALFAVGFCLIFIKKLLRPRALLTLGKGAVGTVLLNLWFLVPFFSYMQGEYRCTDSTSVFEMDAYALPVTKLLNIWSSDMDSIRLGWALLGGAVIFIGCLVAENKLAAKPRRLGLACLVGAAVAAALSTDLFHWADLSQKIGATMAHYLCAIQFPFRYLTISTLLLTFCSVCGLALLRDVAGRRWMNFCAIGLIAVSLIFAALDCSTYLNGVYGKFTVAQGNELSSAKEISGLEYLPVVFDADYTKSEIACNEGITMKSAERHGMGYTITAENIGTTNASIELPLTYYPGYRIQKADSGLAVQMTEHGVVAVTLAPGYSGTFTLTFVEPLSWRVAELVSVLFGAALLIFWRCPQLRKRGITLLSQKAQGDVKNA